MDRMCFLIALPLVACSSPATTDDAGPGTKNDAGTHADAAHSDASAGDASSVNDASTSKDAAPTDDADVGDDASDDAADDAPVTVTDAGGCTTNAECASNFYCAKSNADCNGTGACAVRPQICPSTYIPVCGCDSVTYDNDCIAHSAGENILITNACP